jgi:hypothetical protein
MIASTTNAFLAITLWRYRILNSPIADLSPAYVVVWPQVSIYHYGTISQNIEQAQRISLGQHGLLQDALNDVLTLGAVLSVNREV